MIRKFGLVNPLPGPQGVPGQLGPTGPTGPQGIRGPGGSRGPPGPPADTQELQNKIADLEKRLFVLEQKLNVSYVSSNQNLPPVIGQ
jgi:hypothetical protein